MFSLDDPSELWRCDHFVLDNENLPSPQLNQSEDEANFSQLMKSTIYLEGQFVLYQWELIIWPDRPIGRWGLLTSRGQEGRPRNYRSSEIILSSLSGKYSFWHSQYSSHCRDVFLTILSLIPRECTGKYCPEDSISRNIPWANIRNIGKYIQALGKSHKCISQIHSSSRALYG